MSRLRGGLVEGRETGPVHATCEVIVRRREGAYWLLSLAAKDLAERAEPGQFVEVAVQAQHTLLRRPFSIARVSRQGVAAGTVEVVFDAHGPGTQWLTSLEVHDVVDVLGPLGTPFPLPQRKVNCLLVGGGYGAAPLYYLAESLLRRGLRVDMINGAATGERIMGAIEAKRLSASVVFTTEDGSFGRQGRVTDVMDEVMDASDTGVVYACGPNPMLRAVSEVAARRGVPVQVAVEERMACGIGVCFTCVVPVRGRDKVVRNRRACLDGPVFNGARIDWNRWGVPGGVTDLPGPRNAPSADATPTADEAPSADGSPTEDEAPAVDEAPTADEGPGEGTAEGIRILPANRVQLAGPGVAGPAEPADAGPEAAGPADADVDRADADADEAEGLWGSR